MFYEKKRSTYRAPFVNKCNYSTNIPYLVLACDEQEEM
jgi:hypothetical protein